MDYKEQAENILYDAKDWAGDPHIRKDLSGAAQSISDLLARAEAAEKRVEELEKSLSDAAQVVKTMQESTISFYERRAEKAQRERDEKTPKEVLEAIDELVEFARERMSMVDWLYYANVIGAWRGQKEE